MLSTLMLPGENGAYVLRPPAVSANYILQHHDPPLHLNILTTYWIVEDLLMSLKQLGLALSDCLANLPDGYLIRYAFKLL